MDFLKKKLIMVTLVIALAVCPMTALAAQEGAANYYQNSADAYEAAYYVMSLMELILDEYMGSDVDIEDLYFGALDGISGVLDDYSEYMSVDQFADFTSDLEATEFLYGIGIFVNELGSLEVSSVVPGSSAEENGIIPGDLFRLINSNDVTGMTSGEAVAAMNEGGATIAQLEMMRGTVVYQVTVEKKQVPNTTVNILSFDQIYTDAATDRDNSKFRYVYINAVGEETHHEMEKAIADMQSQGVEKIILDLRDNSGGYLEVAIEVCKQIVPKGAILHRASKNGTVSVVNSQLDKAPFEEIIVLINGNTASAAEIIAAALQDSGTTVVGQTSFGKGVIQSIYDMPDGGVFKLTTGEYYRRSGEKLNLIGITPDVYIDLPLFIQRHEISPDIVNVKKILNFIGYDSGKYVDPDYDSLTKASIISFKKANGLGEDDVIDEETVLALNEALYLAYLESDVVLDAAYEMLFS